MHEVPRHFGAHELFLKELGVREEPSAGDYVQFLSDLAQECKGARLNPNELRAVVAIVQAVASRRKEEVEGRNDNGANSWYGTLYVPDCDSFLRDSDSCLGNDDKWLSVRASFGVQAEGLHLLHPSLGLPTAVQLSIPMITEVLTEKLNLPSKTTIKSRAQLGDDLSVNDVQVKEDSWSPVGTGLEEQLITRVGFALRSEDFIGALNALSNDVDNDIVSKRISPSMIEKEKGSGTNKDEISIRCRRLKLRFIDSVPVRLVLKDSRKFPIREVEILEDISKGTSITESLFYLRREEQNVETCPTLFINASLLTSYLTPEIAVSVGLCSMLRLDVRMATSVACLLSAPVGQRASVLSALRVGYDPLEANEINRGVPGELVIDTDLKLLELKPFRIFRQGEVVAYESKGSSLPSKKIANNSLASEASTSELFDPFAHLIDISNTESNSGKLEGQEKDHYDGNNIDNLTGNIASMNKVNGDSSGKSSDSNTYMRYARVISTGQIDEEGSAVRKVLLKISNSVSKPMLATQIFSFQSARDVAIRKNTSANSLDVGVGRSSGVNRGQMSVNKPSVHPSSLGSNVGDSPPNVGTLGRQPVSQEEIIEAINELHVRAGLPLSPDERNLMARVIELESLYKRSQTEVLTERSSLSDAREALTSASSVKKCQICVCNDISHVMIPCGEICLLFYALVYTCLRSNILIMFYVQIVRHQNHLSLILLNKT
jgi:hypothetical protein